MYCLHKYGKELNCVLHQTYQSCSMRRIHEEFVEKYKNLYIYRSLYFQIYSAS